MAKSFTYYLTLSVIKFKGIKKTFSQNPIDLLKLRKEDVYFPKSIFFKTSSTSFLIGGTKVTEIKTKGDSDKLLVFIHGGAFVSGPSQHHWDSVEKMAKNIQQTVWICNYPKAPEHKISEISSNIDLVYNLTLSKYDPADISLIGDSVGATLIIAMVQRLIKNGIGLPSKLLLISPVMDASMENPDIAAMDKIDPMLSKNGVLSAKKMCCDDGNLKNPMISPLFGSFAGFPNTYLFLAENDITYPDQLLLCSALKELKVEHTVILGEGMPHIWPLLPLMRESKAALDKIINLLNQ
ncbi:alpha/beta hydrolase [Flavobacterium olei]|uniref:alpha/beta hydrolase n=1 Tax=Flavobacterium olei TaxID=1886782 RepID=UPI0032199547